MGTPKATLRGSGLSFEALAPFFAISFGLTWGICALMILFAAQIEAIFGLIGYTNPLFILAVYAPGIAGVFLVWRHYGLTGLGSYVRRLTFWWMPFWWWAFLVIGIPAVFYLGAFIEGKLTDPFPFSLWYNLLPTLAIVLVIGLAEEFGWRGVALPLLQRRFAPLWASLILGTVWGLWYLPAFFIIATPQSALSYGMFFLAALAITVILTPMFNAARGSILIPVLYHLQLYNPMWPESEQWVTFVLAMAAVAIVLLNRRAMLSRDGGVTEVVR